MAQSMGRKKILLTVFVVLTVLCLCFSSLPVGYFWFISNVRSDSTDEVLCRFFGRCDKKAGDVNGAKEFYSTTVHNSGGDVIDVVNRASPAVVTVAVKRDSGSIFEFGWRQDVPRIVSSGTGFFISEDGLLITNEHVVCRASADEVIVIRSDGKQYSVSSVEVDPAQDLAIIRVDLNGDKVPALKFANPSTKLRVGEEVIAIGNPFGENPGTVTRGIVSGVGRNVTASGGCSADRGISYYEGVIQTDAAINSGNSGGPLLNMNAEVIGVNSATLRGAENISYSIPHTTVIKILDRYVKNGEKIVSPYLGVVHSMIDAVTSASLGVPVGAYVIRVEPGSPAEIAGIKKGDIITKIGDFPLNFSLVSTLNLNFDPGQTTTVEVYRVTGKSTPVDGKYFRFSINIGARGNNV